jgi:hypothetical protein
VPVLSHTISCEDAWSSRGAFFDSKFKSSSVGCPSILVSVKCSNWAMTSARIPMVVCLCLTLCGPERHATFTRIYYVK